MVTVDEVQRLHNLPAQLRGVRDTLNSIAAEFEARGDEPQLKQQMRALANTIQSAGLTLYDMINSINRMELR
jgi:hypothetical protein